MKGISIEKRVQKPNIASPVTTTEVAEQPSNDIFANWDTANNWDTPPESSANMDSATQLDFNESSQLNAASILFDNMQTNPQSPIFGASNQFAGALGGATLGNRNILIITPRTNEDVTGIVNNLQNGEACIICFDGMSVVDAQRRLDFLSGVVCAINGSIKPLNNNTYILTPSGLGVRQ